MEHSQLLNTLCLFFYFCFLQVQKHLYVNIYCTAQLANLTADCFKEGVNFLEEKVGKNIR